MAPRALGLGPRAAPQPRWVSRSPLPCVPEGLSLAAMPSRMYDLGGFPFPAFIFICATSETSDFFLGLKKTIEPGLVSLTLTSLPLLGLPLARGPPMQSRGGHAHSPCAWPRGPRERWTAGAGRGGAGLRFLGSATARPGRGVRHRHIPPLRFFFALFCVLTDTVKNWIP